VTVGTYNKSCVPYMSISCFLKISIHVCFLTWEENTNMDFDVAVFDQNLSSIPDGRQTVPHHPTRALGPWVSVRPRPPHVLAVSGNTTATKVF
jgi:hypothetical protein